jgi:hypothetical protein
LRGDWRWLKGMARLLAALTLALAAVAAFAIAPAAASGPYYARGAVGYDDSIYQCGGPARGAFAIISANNGRPFTQNSCLAQELRTAPTYPPAAVYMNTGYSATYAARITGACAGRAAGVSGSPLQREAYAIGCSEAASTRDYIYRATGKRVRSWWLDVETANSWSASNLVLNRAVLRGAIDYLKPLGAIIGIYSTSRQWNEITGGWAAPGIDANWVAGAASPADAALLCGASITGAPVWIVQQVRAGLDFNRGC